jgi:uncharacterized protein YsxB (DUF464 family)
VTVKVCFYKDSRGINHLKAFGHTGFDQKGKDIACAAVSAVIESLALGAGKAVSDTGFICKRADGAFEIFCVKGLSDKARSDFNLLAESVIVTLKAIDMAFPGSCTIEEKTSFASMLDLEI